MKPRGKKGPKDPFEKLPMEWRTSMESAQDTEIDAIIQTTAMNTAALMEAKVLDMDLKRCQEAAKTAGAVYSEGKKGNDLKINFLRKLKISRGRDVPEASDFAKKDPEPAAEKGPAEV